MEQFAIHRRIDRNCGPLLGVLLPFHCCDPIPHRRKLRKGAFIWLLVSGFTVHLGREDKAAELCSLC